MPEYQLEVKQIVDYPRCRVYRQFIRTLMEDRNIRLCGSSCLFYFTVLCSYANFRTSYRKIGGVSYTVYPGEWICEMSELIRWFRVRYRYQVIEILDLLQMHHHIIYSTVGRQQVIKFKKCEWKKHNTILDYNAPCQKDMGFFFFPISKVAELISIGKCSEMDILLDLWMHTIYNDEQVQGSNVGLVVYFRNGTGSPLISYADLAKRWGISKATVGRILKRLAGQGYILLMSFPGCNGSAIYLSSYLSTMFQISDIMIDKEEVAMSLNIIVSVSSDTEPEMDTVIQEEQLFVSENEISVSKSGNCQIIGKVVQVLAAGGLVCCECPNSKYKLSPLFLDCRKGYSGYRFIIVCGETELYHFELRFCPV